MIFTLLLFRLPRKFWVVETAGIFKLSPYDSGRFWYAFAAL
jgi:hypothetical protein